MTDYVVTGLVKRRAELTGEIERTHEDLRGMLADLEALDATLLMFAPDFQIEAIQPKAFRPPKDWSRRGEMTRIILSILRQAAEPLTTRDIALQLLVERALDKSDLKLLRLSSAHFSTLRLAMAQIGATRSVQTRNKIWRPESRALTHRHQANPPL